MFSSLFHARHPNLQRLGYDQTSEKSETYNCVSWALGRTDIWYEPGGEPGTYWPEDVRTDTSLAAYISLFLSYGFEPAVSAEPETGYVRVAVYGTDDDDEFTHAAVQLPGGRWSSKCGEDHDISHDLAALEDGRYGRVRAILRRAVAVTQV